MGTGLENKNILNQFIFDNIKHDNGLVIDLGCGKGDRLSFVNENITKHCCGIEIFDDYIEEATQKNLVIHKGEILKFLTNVAAKNYNNIQYMMIDVLEHLKKEDAYEAISLMKQTGNTIIIFTPQGYVPQEEYDGNEYQKHLSQWEAEELINLDFNVEVKENFHEGLPKDWSTNVIFASWTQEK